MFALGVDILIGERRIGWVKGIEDLLFGGGGGLGVEEFVGLHEGMDSVYVLLGHSINSFN